MNLLLSALVEGDASRLHRALVEERQLAIEVSGHWQEGFDPGLLWLSLTLPEGADPEEARQALDAELAAVAADGVTEAELERARNLATVGLWKKLAAIDGKAQLLGEYEVFHGDWSLLFDARRGSRRCPPRSCVPSPRRSSTRGGARSGYWCPRRGAKRGSGHPCGGRRP